MKPILFFSLLIMMAFSSCEMMGPRIEGNGKLTAQQRTIAKANNIKLAGSYDVEITPGTATSVRVEADENLLPYLITREENGYLVIKSKDNASLSSSHDIKIFITTPQLEEIHIAGSGNLTGTGKFTGGSKLVIKIAGSGDVKLDVNTPRVEGDIAGSGTIHLAGETRDELIKIGGSGNFYAEQLKAENATVKIAGNGDVKVDAESNLDIHIAGSGTVYYKGNASVKQSIAGSGDVKKIE